MANLYNRFFATVDPRKNDASPRQRSIDRSLVETKRRSSAFTVAFIGGLSIALDIANVQQWQVPTQPPNHSEWLLWDVVKL